MILNSLDLPPLQFVTRSKSGMFLYTMKDGEDKPTKEDFFPSTNCEEVVWSKDGSLCIYRESTGVRVFDMATRTLRFALDLPKVVAVSISPRIKWLVTITPFKSAPNLQIWDLATGELHFELVQKSFSRSCWPYLQWDAEEKHALFHSGETITIFNGADLNDVANQQIIRNGDQGLMSSFVVTSTSLVSLSPSASCPAFVLFSPLKEGEGVVAFFADHSKEPKEPKEPSPHFVIQRQQRVLNCNQALCEWSAKGDRAVLTASSDIDRTGVSYYGSTQLFYVFNDFKPRADVILGIMRDEQSVQQSRFSADGAFLCAVTTSVPATTQLYSTKECKEEGSCGKLNVNTIRWSPHNRLLLLGGFGNLSGDVTVWDNLEHKRIVQFKTEYITSCEWAPDSRHLVMGTCYPRMKIDNRLYVYKYNGVKLFQEDVDVLYEIAIRPVPEGLLPLRPPTALELAELKQQQQQKAPAKYVPPHLRNKGAVVGGRAVPGMKAPANREKKPAKKPGAAKPTNQPKSMKPASPTSPATPTGVDAGANLLDAIFASVKSQPAAEEETAVSLQKKLRAVQKKLRDIEMMKAKWSMFNEEQLQKLAKEEGLREEESRIMQKLSSLK
ncbi:eukaryotic translation initiation factor 2A [Blastocystis sp. ATCC 50177/Nand II]|uniref:Eukaryotic translation initiation factor 2A n=1 Tax=Blastocystis sp. subtype 1 (strain ATCC 50177 / NandII) TaxID=478820 RepID=A0A196S3W7_BLAHN|nr:eukaryotic translation initiation factor 2A [Blastocystis sp. ATCC 50177/Nand II]